MCLPGRTEKRLSLPEARAVSLNRRDAAGAYHREPGLPVSLPTPRGLERTVLMASFAISLKWGLPCRRVEKSPKLHVNDMHLHT